MKDDDKRPTAHLVAATSGEVTHFKDARHFASWVGLTPKESSSGMTRRLGRISKRGDRYLRMLLTHVARSVRRAATVADRQGRPVDDLHVTCLQGRSIAGYPLRGIAASVGTSIGS